MILDPLIDPSTVNPLGALLISLIAICIVVLTLIIVIIVTTVFQKGIATVLSKTQIQPRPENRVLETDEDAVAAALVAVIEFHRETGKDARIVSIRPWED